jgi:hypothetical protein
VTTTALIVVCIVIYSRYKNSTYHKITNLPFLSLLFDKGHFGEYMLYKELKCYEDSGARFLFNVYLPKRDGGTSEVDMVMVCSKGIFVFESKNYSGWIFGNQSSKYWYQTLPAGRGRSRKEQFYNPILQNNSHINSLCNYLEIHAPIWSVIVFSNRCTFKDLALQSNTAYVIHRRDVSSTISSIMLHSPTDYLSNESVNGIFNALLPFTQVDEITRTQHIVNTNNNTHPSYHLTNTSFPPIINNPHASDVDSHSPVCPWCSSPLVLRTASRGKNAGNKFYGCSRFPKCRYIKNITKISQI